MIGVSVVDFYDPAEADWTGAFVRAIATGRTVLVPAGTYYIQTGQIVLGPGQRIVGEGQLITTIRASGHGDAIRLCDWPNQNASHFSGVEHLSLAGITESETSGGIVAVGGANCHVDHVMLGGFAENFVLDGHEDGRFRSISFWVPVGTTHRSRVSILMTDGADSTRGFTVPNSTNCNWISEVHFNYPAVEAIKFGGTANVVQKIQHNGGAGTIRMRGNQNVLADAAFEFDAAGVASGLYTEAVLIDAPGTANIVGATIERIYAGAMFGLPFVRITGGTLAAALWMRDIYTGPACSHMVKVYDNSALSGNCFIHGRHEGTGAPVSMEQPAAAGSIFSVHWTQSPDHEHEAPVGISSMQPKGRLEVSGSGYLDADLTVRRDATRTFGA